MNKHNCIYLIVLLLFLCSCHKNRQFFPADIQPQPVVIQRFDSALLSLDTLVEPAAITIERLYNEYPLFMPVFAEEILGVDATDTAFLSHALPQYLGDTIYHFAEVNSKVLATFCDISDIRQELEMTFAKILYLYPDWNLPEITFFVSGFNASLFFWQPLSYNEDEPQQVRMAVGVDMYLGTDYEYYNRVVWNYQKQTMRKECIPVDVVSAYLFRMIPFRGSKSRLLENILYRGKIMYLLSVLMPQQPEYEIMGYSKQQFEWAEKHEKQVWQMIIEKHDLWKSESPVLTSYLNDGPFTAEISQEAPPRLGTFIGWHIAKSYINNNPQVTLKELMEETDAQKVLEMSYYKP